MKQQLTAANEILKLKIQQNEQEVQSLQELSENLTKELGL